MIVRIVELSIREEELDVAKALLAAVAPRVRSFNGCTHLRILFDIHQPHHITTYSHWNSEDDLNNYRASLVFKDFWGKIKPLFAEAPRAWSSSTLHHLP